MTARLKFLLVEDNPADAELVERALRRAGYELDGLRVETEKDFLAGLQTNPDLIISDYELPQFSGLHALALLQRSESRIPFIIISGTIGEETAVAAIKQGATDYLLKDRLGRLGSAVEHALEEGRLRRERLHAVEALKQSKERLRLVTENARLGLVMLDAARRYIFANATYRQVLGIAEENILGRTVAEVLAPQYETQIRPRLDEAFAGGRVVYELQRTVDEREGYYSVRYEPMKTGGTVTSVVVVITDITEHKRAEARLRESEQRFRQMAEAIEEVVWLTDVTKNQMLYISPAYERIWGRPREELYTAPMTWSDAIHVEDRARILVAATTKQVLGEYREEYRIVRPDGTTRWILDRAFPIKNERGEVYRMVGVAEDITERKKLEEQFLHAQRMEAIGTLAGGMAHDLNNILAPVLMVAGVLKPRMTSPQDRHIIGLVENSAQRGAGIIRQLLMFSRGVSGQRMALQLRHLIKEMLGIMRETFPREIVIEDSTPVDLWLVMGDATQLHQVLMNLCVNARDAMPAGGLLALRARNLEIDAAALRVHPDAKEGLYVVLEVRDTGQGIPPNIIDRIFDPFFTTKGVGKGTGLGLSTVIGIVKSHNGFALVKSDVGKGSVFEIYLPATKPVEPAAVARADDATAKGNRELVLVVDDEGPIREATCLLLEQHNYQALPAANGKEALSAFLEHQDLVRVVLTDLMMPVMNGLVLIRALQAIKPDVTVVPMTGLDEKGKLDELHEMGVAEPLLKPMVASVLLAAIRRAIDRNKTSTGSVSPFRKP